MKNLKKVLFSLVFIVGIMFCCITPAYAKKGVVIVPDPNPEGVVGCSIEAPEYPAYSDDEDEQEEQNDENEKPGKENNKKNDKK